MINEVLDLTAIIMASIALIFSIIACVIVLALKFSTHRIEWRTYESPEEINNNEEEEPMDEAEKAQGSASRRPPKLDPKTGKPIDPIVAQLKAMYSEEGDEE